MISIHKRLYNGINRLLNRVKKSKNKNNNKIQKRILAPVDLSGAMVIPRPKHCISRKNIHRYALKVLYQLKDGGYQSYLVGGAVRDLLLGITPKDFDIATDAHPEEVNSLIRNCRLIGRRFRLAHIHFGRYIIEVATFRADHTQGDNTNAQGRILSDNHYGNLADDAQRRDFTINALYYNIADFSLIDYCNGMADIEAKLIRLIGDPEQRYQEDPVRILRAIRFSAKLDFDIEAKTQAPIKKMGQLLKGIPPSRLYEEILKVFLTGHGRKSFILLEYYQLQAYLFSPSSKLFQQDNYKAFIYQALDNSDKRVAENKPVIPAFLFAALLWPAVDKQYQSLSIDDTESNPYNILIAAGGAISQLQNESVYIPKRVTQTMRDIWQLQPRLEQMPTGKRSKQTTQNKRFRAAFDFLILRVSLEPELQTAVDYWVTQQEIYPVPAPTEDTHSKRRYHRKRKPRT